MEIDENTTDGVPDSLKTEVKSRWKIYLAIFLIGTSLGGWVINTALIFWNPTWYGYEEISNYMKRNCRDQCQDEKDDKTKLEKKLTDQIHFLNVELQKWKCKAGSCE